MDEKDHGGTSLTEGDALSVSVPTPELSHAVREAAKLWLDYIHGRNGFVDGTLVGEAVAAAEKIINSDMAGTEPPRVGWRRWAWVDSEGRLSIMKANATREEVAELGEPDERLIRVQITEVGSGNPASPENSDGTRRSEAP